MFTKGYQGVQIHLASKNVWYFYNLFNPFFFWPFYPNVFSLFLKWQTYLEPKNFFIYHFRLQGVFKHSENYLFLSQKWILEKRCGKNHLNWFWKGTVWDVNWFEFLREKTWFFWPKRRQTSLYDEKWKKTMWMIINEQLLFLTANWFCSGLMYRRIPF